MNIFGISDWGFIGRLRDLGTGRTFCEAKPHEWDCDCGLWERVTKGKRRKGDGAKERLGEEEKG